MEKQYNLELNGQELQTVFDALLERPFKVAAPLVARIQELYKAGHAVPKEEAAPDKE